MTGTSLIALATSIAATEGPTPSPSALPHQKPEALATYLARNTAPEGKDDLSIPTNLDRTKGMTKADFDALHDKLGKPAPRKSRSRPAKPAAPERPSTLTDADKAAIAAIKKAEAQKTKDKSEADKKAAKEKRDAERAIKQTAREVHAAEKADNAKIASATHFVVSLFLGTGKFQTTDAPTLAAARDLAREVTANATNGRKAMIYAQLPEGPHAQVIVPDYYSTPTSEDAMSKKTKTTKAKVSPTKTTKAKAEKAPKAAPAPKAAKPAKPLAGEPKFIKDVTKTPRAIALLGAIPKDGSATTAEIVKHMEKQEYLASTVAATIYDMNFDGWIVRVAKGTYARGPRLAKAA